MMDSKALNMPLAESLRPKMLEDIVGQQHLIGPGRPLRIAYESAIPHNMIFWGPPGVGKTTLARLAAQYFDADFIAISAVLAGVKEIRDVIEKAQINVSMGRRTLLFIDEIHRFNKSQQDALLPHTESGLICMIGATTENPAFEVNRALLSRSEVYVLKSLETADLQLLLQKATASFALEGGVAERLIFLADGDARKLLNHLQILINSFDLSDIRPLTLKDVDALLGEKLRAFDKNGDVFYDQISALHKSVRGSNPDAALYWFHRLLDAGASPLYLGRRIMRMAWEDIGLADPKALQIVESALACYERLGSPEGELALASAVIYLSVAAKSNAAYKAFKASQAYVKQDNSKQVPEHLRNAPTSLAKSMGHGTTYRYAHDEPYAYAAGESYLPEGMTPKNWYQPVDRGLELKIKEKLKFLKSLDEKASV